MNTKTNYWKCASLALLLPAMISTPMSAEPNVFNKEKETVLPKKSVKADDENLVQIALLLDTSGSMGGLIDQARCQLWNVVSELSKAERNGKKISLQIAVYQYGADSQSDSDYPWEETGFLRQVLGFTDNLDQVSASLFSLKVGGGPEGGKEYCGQAIKDAVNDLEWSEESDVYKTIFIAGNESFDQGPVGFGELLTPIDKRSIVVNTVYCGTKYNAQDQWRSAAGLAGGMYAFIDHNHHLPEMETPYDGKMRELNRLMNETFVWYGEGADTASKNQLMQDENAGKLSDHAYAARMSAKIGHLYHHVHHDLVDAILHGKADLSKMPEAKMPSLLAKMPPLDREKFIKEKVNQRQAVRRQMADVIAARHRFLETKMKVKSGQSSEQDLVLGEALAAGILKQAKAKGYLFSD